MSNLPTKTLAAILVEQKRDLVIAEIDLPKNLEVGQVLVRFHYSGICGSQIGEIDGVKGVDNWLPHLLGHEASGTVLAIGPGVSFVKPNDRVVIHWRRGRGIESVTPKYSWNGKTVNAGWVTSFNQHAIISENRLTVIPQDTDLKTAALYGCAVTTGLGTIENTAKIRLGDRVVIFGAGGIGLNLIQGAVLAGATEIIAVDLFDNRLELARSMGATAVVNAKTCDAFAKINELLGGQKPDVFLDNTGKPEIISQGYKLVHREGRVILVGVPAKGSDTGIYTLDLHFGKTIIGTTGGEADPTLDIPRYMNLFAKRQLSLSPLITEVAPLSAVNYLIEGMRNGRTAGRCLIDLEAAL